MLSEISQAEKEKCFLLVSKYMTLVENHVEVGERLRWKGPRLTYGKGAISRAPLQIWFSSEPERK